MAENNPTLDMFYQHWKVYQDQLKQSVAPLRDEQLALRAGPDLRTVAQIAHAHHWHSHRLVYEILE